MVAPVAGTLDPNEELEERCHARFFSTFFRCLRCQLLYLARQATHRTNRPRGLPHPRHNPANFQRATNDR